MALALARACQQQAREPTADPRAPFPPLAQVRKEDFDNAIKSAQEALRAKTSSSQMMLEQASSAMRNAVSALSLSEQEVANLRAVVKELKEGRTARAATRRSTASERSSAPLSSASRSSPRTSARCRTRLRGCGTSRRAWTCR